MKTKHIMAVVVIICAFYIQESLSEENLGKASVVDDTNVVMLDDNDNAYNLCKHTQYLEDKTGKICFEDIRSGSFEKAFVNSSSDTLNFGFSSSVYWIKLKVRNKRKKPQGWFIEIAYPHLDKIDFYFPDQAGNYQKRYASDHLPFKKREIKYRNFVFSIFIPNDAITTLYLRIETESSIQLPLTLWDPSAFAEKVNTELYGFGLYYGIMLIMILYNLFIFIGIRDTSYLYYVIFVAMYTLGQASIDGFAFEYLWSNFPGIWNKSVLVSLYLANLTMFQFNISFLKTRENAFSMHVIFVSGIIFFALLAAASIAIIPYRIGVKLYAVSAVFFPLASLVGGIKTLKKGVPAAKYYVYAWTMFCLGIAALALRNLGIIPNVFVTNHGTLIGSSTGVLLMSLGLADRINTMRKDNDRLRDQMTHRLENMVLQRTEELQAAMEELTSTNDQLMEARDALWGEMELAKRIQTVLLPKQPRMNNYEIAAHMVMADQVGGDYYDVINAAGRTWLLIGDVSGHGVPAGLIMMMAQTAIHATIQQNPLISPSELLTLVNRTISNNIKLLGEDKYMTITALSDVRNGEFSFSGLHQDIFIFRSKSFVVEEIETEGLWIGITDNIDNMLKDCLLKLDPGDAMLLYTDGITEGWRKGAQKQMNNHEDNMFGGMRLKNLFQRLGGKSAEEIRDGILAAFTSDYESLDDVTLLVVKRIA